MLASRAISKNASLGYARQYICTPRLHFQSRAYSLDSFDSSSNLESTAQSPTLDASLLNQIKSAFPDTSTSNHLHARIDLLLSNDPTIRVGFVPLQPFSRNTQTLQVTSRRSIKGVLDSLLSDPLSSDQKWQSTLKDRNLSKNCVVSYSPTFDGSTITHNSIVEYKVPFTVSKEGLFEQHNSSRTGKAFFSTENDNAPKTSLNSLNSAAYAAKYQQTAAETGSEQFNALSKAKYRVSLVEMTSPGDSLQHLLKCHRLIYITADPTDAQAIRSDPSRFLPVANPYRVLIDYPSEKLQYTAESTIARIERDTQAPIVSSEMQMHANELLKESPAQNADKFVKLHSRSNLAAMNRSAFLFPAPKKYNDDVDPDSIDNIGVDPAVRTPQDVFYGGKPSDVADITGAQTELAQTVLRTCSEIVDNADEVIKAIVKEGSEMSIRRKQWAVEAHTELQTTLETHLEAMFSGRSPERKRRRFARARFLGRSADERGTDDASSSNIGFEPNITPDYIPWYRLYWKVDEVYSIVDQVFLRYYFLPRAQDRYKYLQGRIDQFADLHHLPAEAVAEAEASNDSEKSRSSITTVEEPVLEKKIKPYRHQTLALFDKARQDILQTAGTELHNNALRSLLTSLFGVQLPLIVLPLCAVYILDFCSLYAAGSIMALGVVVGFSRLQASWHQAAGKFKATVLESARLSINEAEQNLWKQWEARVAAQEIVTKKRRKLIKELKEVIDAESQK